MAALAFLGINTNNREGLEFRFISSLNDDIHPRFRANPESNQILIPKNKVLRDLTHIYPAQNSRGVILIWGDSMAGAWSPLFQSIGLDEHYTIIRIEAPSCLPIINARKHYSPFPANRIYCYEGSIQAEVFNYLDLVKPEHIFIAGAWANYNPYNGFEFMSGSGIAEDPNTTKNMFQDDLPKTLQRLSHLANVTFIESWPRLLVPLKYGVDRRLWASSKDSDTQVLYSEYLLMNKFLEPTLGDSKNDISILSPSDKLCDEYCSIRLKGYRLYQMDGIHPSEYGVMLFQKEVLEILNSNVKFVNNKNSSGQFHLPSSH